MTREDVARDGPGSAAWRLAAAVVLHVVAGLSGVLIAWVDTRPTWDDTGVTVAALAFASAVFSAAGVRFWLAAPLVAGPLCVALAARGSAASLVVLAIGVA